MTTPTIASTIRRSNGRRIAALAFLAVLAATTTACEADTPSTADNNPTQTRSATPAALPTQDWNRLACHTLPADMLDLLDNLADTRKAAEHAGSSSDAVMREHGRTLLGAVTARETADLNGDHNAAVDANLDISKAALDMAESCSTLYGDGPW